MWLGFQLTIASVALGQADDLLVGIWSADEGFQIVDLLFRSDGRYQLDTRSTDPVLDFSSSERGRYAISGQTLILTPYDYLGEPQDAHYEFQVTGNSLTLTRLDFGFTQVYQLKTGSRADVLAREQVDPDLVRTWGRTIPFFGKAEYTFRPGGYYLLKNTPDDNTVFIETDLGETAELTLEDGRRNLFWSKDYQILSEWAAERQPIPCEAPVNANPSLRNTGLSLATSIEPDDISVPGPIRIQLTGPDAGHYAIRGTTESAVNLVVERAGGLDVARIGVQ